jgi:hypothetical protein
VSSITNDVAELESLVESLQAENRILHNTKVQHEFELFELRQNNKKLQLERDQARDACTTMKLILDEAGAAIIHGMKRFREISRDRQAKDLEKGEGLPLFLEKEAPEQTVQ